MDVGYLEVKNVWQTVFTSYQFRFCQKDLKIIENPLNLFGSSSGLAAGFRSWLLDALFGVLSGGSGVKNAGLVVVWELASYNVFPFLSLH